MCASQSVFHFHFQVDLPTLLFSLQQETKLEWPYNLFFFPHLYSRGLVPLAFFTLRVYVLSLSQKLGRVHNQCNSWCAHRCLYHQIINKINVPKRGSEWVGVGGIPFLYQSLMIMAISNSMYHILLNLSEILPLGKNSA